MTTRSSIITAPHHPKKNRRGASVFTLGFRTAHSMGDSELTVIRSVGRGKWHIRGERGCRTAPPDPAAERSGSTAAVLEAIDEDLAARCSNCWWPDDSERRQRFLALREAEETSEETSDEPERRARATRVAAARDHRVRRPLSAALRRHKRRRKPSWYCQTPHRCGTDQLATFPRLADGADVTSSPASSRRRIGCSPFSAGGDQRAG